MGVNWIGRRSRSICCPRWSREVGKDIEILLDTGIMSGADVVAAIAMGARFTLIGRAYLYGLMAGGEAGVDRAIEILSGQVERTMRLLGVTCLEELTPDHVTQLVRLAPRPADGRGGGLGPMAVGIRDVAAAASVSVGTVSNVLNAPERVAPATVARVHAAIEQLGFVRNDAARQLRAGRSRCVGLLVLDVGNPFFTDVARSAERHAAHSNLVVLLGTSDDDPRRERAYLETFDEQRVFGLLISPVGEDLDRLLALHGRGVPVVLVDRDGAGTPFASVAVDDVAGGRLAAGHLCEQGRTPHRLRRRPARPAAGRRPAHRCAGGRRRTTRAPHWKSSPPTSPACWPAGRRGSGCATARRIGGPTRCSAPTTCWRSGCCRR